MPVMYLVVVSVETPGWQADINRLRRPLHGGAAVSDRLRHASLDVSDGQAAPFLYLQAIDRPDAARLADQLSRRTMAAVPSGGRWRIASVRTL